MARWGSGRQDRVSCAGSTPLLPWGGPGRGSTARPRARGPANATSALHGNPRPIEGALRSGVRASGGLPAEQPGMDGPAHPFGPGVGHFRLGFWCAVVLVH